jgi:hypothetical protein
LELKNIRNRTIRQSSSSQPKLQVKDLLERANALIGQENLFFLGGTFSFLSSLQFLGLLIFFFLFF